MGDAEEGFVHTILVVSQDEHVREEARSGFPQDVRVMFASGSRDAWQLLQDVVPAAVVVDMRAGSAGGFGLLRDMSQAIALSDVPSLMLIERAQDAWLAEQAGATIYRVKPVDPSELITDTMSMFPATVGD